MNKVKEYFDRKASNYDLKRTKGLLEKQILKESQAALKMLDVKKGEKVLDCGCGAGYYGLRIKKLGGNYLGIDISEKMVKATRKKGLKAKIADIQSLKSEKKFDKILLSGSLEFCKNPLQVLRSCQKNLKKSGLVVAIVPRFNIFGIAYYFFHLFHGFGIKLFTLKNIQFLMKKAGFSITEIRKPNSLVYVICARNI